MAVLTVQRPAPNGVPLTFKTIPADGWGVLNQDTFLNTGNEFLVVSYTGLQASQLVSLTSPAICDYGVGPPETPGYHDANCTVLAGQTRMFGPFSTDQFNDADGFVTLTYGGEDLHIAVLSFKI